MPMTHKNDRCEILTRVFLVALHRACLLPPIHQRRALYGEDNGSVSMLYNMAQVRAWDEV